MKSDYKNYACCNVDVHVVNNDPLPYPHAFCISHDHEHIIIIHVHTLQHSGEALDTACKELKKMLRAVQSNIAQKDIPSVLLLLTVKMKVIEQESTRCSGSS